jgi:hypothetical protein
MWPWQAFDWGVFWAALAVATICFVVGMAIQIVVSYLRG